MITWFVVVKQGPSDIPIVIVFMINPLWAGKEEHRTKENIVIDESAVLSSSHILHDVAFWVLFVLLIKPVLI